MISNRKIPVFPTPVNRIRMSPKPLSLIKHTITVKHHTREINRINVRPIRIPASTINKNKVLRQSKQFVGQGLNLEAIRNLKNVKTRNILCIVGNGPSHKEAELDRLVGLVDFMSINKPDERIWPTHIWLYCDNSQTKRHHNAWATYNGILINSSAVKDTKLNTTKIKTLHGKGLSLDLTHGMNIDRSSVYAGIQVGLWMGYEHIYVFGCDMSAVNGKLYPWGSNPDVPDKNRNERFKFEAENYTWMANNISQKIRDKITFCTSYNPFEFIKKFEHFGHRESIDTIINRCKDQK